MPKGGKGARVKGHSFERLIANFFTSELGLKFLRGLEQTRDGGKTSSDISSKFLPMFHFELKRQKRANIKAAFEQAVNDIGKSLKMPIVITKDDHGPILVTMAIEDFTPIFKAYCDSVVIPHLTFPVSLETEDDDEEDSGEE